MSRLVRWLVIAAIGVFVLVALGSAAIRPVPSTPEQTAREVSQSLRCPTCAGESIADSSALLSDAMRQTVEEQVEQGRAPGEIRAWFAERYGDDVLLEPPRRGYGWLLWGLPLGLVGITVVVLVRHRRSPRWWLGVTLAVLTVAATAGVWVATSGDEPSGSPGEFQAAGEPGGAGNDTGHGAGNDAANDSGPAAGDTVAVLRDAVEQAPGDTDRRLALAGALERAGDAEGTAAEYAAVVRMRPLDPDVRYRYAFALVRTGEVKAAVGVLDETLTFDESHAPSLLLLGALLREEQPERAGQLLQRFAELEPEHPASGQVDELLDDEQTPRR